MKPIDKYVVVVPTHRIKHLRKNLKSILSQTVKPDLIIAIDDTDYLLNPEIKKEFDEINKNIPVKYYNKNDDIDKLCWGELLDSLHWILYS